MLEIHDVLAKYPLDCQSAHIEPLGSAGGLSGAQFWSIAAPRGDLILRRWPVEYPPPARLQFIHSVLRHASNRGCEFVPFPATTQAGQSFVSHAGHLWELAPRMPGVADFNTAPSLEKLRAAMRVLAQFHNAVADFAHPAAPGTAGGVNAVTRHLGRVCELSSNEINNLAYSIRDTTWPDLAPLAYQFLAQLPQAISRAIAQLEPLANSPLPLQPCLRDIWHDHVLFTGEEVAGLIDFGAVDIDTPATDIARLLGSLAAQAPLPFWEGQGEGSTNISNIWRDGLVAYNTIRPLSPAETRAAYALNTSGNILAGYNWIRWIYVEERQFEYRPQIIGRFRRIVAAIISAAPD